MLFLYLAFRNVNLHELGEILKSTNYFFVIGGIFIGVVIGSAVRAKRWGILLEPIKKGIRFKGLFSATAIGYMVNNLIPRSGEVVRPFLLGKDEDIPKASVFATIIVERIIDTTMFLLMFGLALIYFKGRIAAAIPDIDFAIIILTAGIFLLLGTIMLMMFKPEPSLKVIKFFTRFLPKKIHDRIDNIFTSLLKGFSILKDPRRLLRMGFWSIVLWVVYLFSTYIPFYSFDIFTENTPFLESLWNANLLLVLINVAMFIPSPAATGPYHYICKVTLVSIFSVNEAKALGYATSTHLVSFVLFFILGIYFFLTHHYKISELKEGTSS